jgi:Spy/CpxP family protein refolding chaperone
MINKTIINLTDMEAVMLKKIMILLIAVVLVISNLQAALGSPRMSRHMKYRIHLAEKNLFSGRMLLKMKADIGLTEDQVAKIEKMGTAHKENLIKREANLKVMQLKFDTHLQEKKINRAKLEKVVREIARLRTDMQIENINHLLDLRELLTAEQLIKIDELKKEMRHKRWNRRKDWRKDRVKDHPERRR